MFWAGWSCLGLGGGVRGWMGVFWPGRSRFRLVPIGDIDVTRTHAHFFRFPRTHATRGKFEFSRNNRKNWVENG